MTDQEKMAHEFARVKALVDVGLEDLANENGDVRFFNAALLSHAMKIHTEVEGAETLERAITKIASRELVRRGGAGRC